jgi:RNA polymerase sigma-70 factor (ECF subfamily)
MLRDRPDPSLTSARPRRTTDAPDAALVARVARGDIAAFEMLYRVYHPRLTRFIGLMTQRRSMIEEVVNDTMLVVWKRADTYNQQCKASTWIFAIAYRTALKACVQDDPVEDADDEQRPSDGAGPEQQHSDQGRAALARALGALSAEQRCALVLTYFMTSLRRNAQIVDCPVDTVKTRVFHGQRQARTAGRRDRGLAVSASSFDTDEHRQAELLLPWYDGA